MNITGSFVCQRMGSFGVGSDVCKSLKPVHKGSGVYSGRDFIIKVPWELGSGAGLSIRAEEAWKTTRGSPNVTIAIIDEGFDVQRLPHGSEVEVLSASKCTASSPRLSKADHGACLSELIAGSRKGYPGVAPQCRLLLIELPSFCTEAEEASVPIQCGSRVLRVGPGLSGPECVQAGALMRLGFH
jgi:hypothetical protein